MASTVSCSPPRATPIQYDTPNGTRWAKEKAAAGGSNAFDYPTDPKSIGPWILGECIGKGASGRVKIARHKYTGQLAAVKILPLAPLVNSRASLATQQAKSEKQRLGVEREITMMKLMNHPNIMHIYDVYEGSKELFLVLEYVEGGELFDFLVNRGRLPPIEALAFFKQIVYGLNYAHTFSIIHRDLKPENILIASLSPPIIKIADWGMAAFAPPSLQLETSCGSPHYASPEIVNGEKYEGNATDIWSCGVILFALLTGRLPFDDKNVRNLLAKVKVGKFDMPSWLDPLAKDLLSRMLSVDVHRRITIPEILSHPWMNAMSPALPRTLGAPGSHIVGTPPLPPSPSTLARPIADASMIDAGLLADLRIIWGRHADPEGESIKRDLCSPAGYGVHAKAFYFLLGNYRDENAKHAAEEAHLSNDVLGIGRIRTYGMGSLTFNLGWELDANAITPTIPQLQTSTYTTIPVPIGVDSGDLSSRFSSTVAPPVMARNSTVTISRERAISPAGPRAQSESSRSRHSHHGNSALGHARPQSAYSATSRSSVINISSHSRASTFQPRSSFSNGQTGGPRPPPPRRGYTYSAPHSRPSTNDQHGVSGIPFPQNQSRRVSSATYRPSTRLSRPKSATGLSTGYARQSSGGESSSRIPLVPVLSPTPVHSPSPILSGPFPLLDVDIGTSSIVDIGLPPREPRSPMAESKPKVQLGEKITDSPKKSPRRGTRDRSSRVASPRGGEVDKENRSFAEEGWSYVGADEGRSMVVRDASSIPLGGGEAANTNAVKGKKGKGLKNRPPPLDFPVLARRRSTVALGSPIGLSPPIMGGGSNSRTISSPVVGEFKGWFSNLFGWKNHNLPPAGTGVFYSSDDISKTRFEVGKFVQSLGIYVEGAGFNYGNPDSESTKEESILRCRISDDPSGALAGLTLKNLKFRIEMTPANAGEGGVALKSPQVSPFFQSSGVGGAPLTAIVMVQEKGSATAFKAVWRRLKEVYEDQGSSAYPCFSPTIGNTPLPTPIIDGRFGL